MADIKPWDVWWAYVQFEDSPEIKRRPVVVLQTGAVIVIALKVTSHEERNIYGDTDITYWKSAGLSKPSTVRAAYRLDLEYSAFDKKIGELHALDRRNIIKALHEL